MTTAHHPIIANTAINIVNTAVSFIIGYAMTPFIVHRLGIEEYGVWVFLGIFSISGYFSLLDFGFQGAAIKYIAEYTATGDRRNLQATVTATLQFFMLTGTIAAVVLGVVNATVFDTLFRLPPEQLGLIRFLVSLIAASYLLQFPTLAFTAILEGLQRYDYLRGIGVVTMLGGNLVLLLFLGFSGGLPLVVGVSLGTSAVLALAYAYAVKRLLPGIRLTLKGVDATLRRQLFLLSSKLFASKIIGLVFNNTDKILIGVFLAVTDQTQYDIVNKIHIILLSLLSMVNQAVLPATSEFAARGDRNALQVLLLRSTKYAAALAAPALVFFLLFPREFLSVWVGHPFAYLAPLVVFYCSHFVVTMLVGVSSTMLVGINRVEKAIHVSMWAAALNLAISLLTVQRLGIWGLVGGTVIAYAISSVMYIFITNRIFGIPNARFFRQVVVPVFPLGLGLTAAAWLVKPALTFTGLVPWLLVALGFYAVYLGLFYALSVSRDERRTLGVFFAGLFARLRRRSVPA